MKFYLLIILILILNCCEKSTESINNPNNKPPIIDSISVLYDFLSVVRNADLTCYAYDPDGDPLQYKWKASAGEFYGSGKTIKLIIPSCCDSLGITVEAEVSDPYGLKATKSIKIKNFK